MSIIVPIVEGVLAAMCACGVLVLLWIAWCEVARALDRRKRAGRPPPRCPCGCGYPLRAIPGLPVDGHPLDDYENRKFGSVLIGYLNSPEDSSEKEDHR